MGYSVAIKNTARIIGRAPVYWIVFQYLWVFACPNPPNPRDIWTSSIFMEFILQMEELVNREIN